MKHLLTSAAIAAALVIAGPALAQTKKASGGAGRDVGRTPAASAPAAGTAPAPAAGAPAAAPAPTAHVQRHHRVVHHHRMAHYRASPGDTMTEQLNREELGRIQGAGAPPPPPPPPPSSLGPRPSSTGGYTTR